MFNSGKTSETGNHSGSQAELVAAAASSPYELTDTRRAFLRAWVRARNWLLGLEHYADPSCYFEPGGLEEAETICAEANRDLLAFVRPPETIEPANLRRESSRARRDGLLQEHWSFDSPRPSGVAENDRVHFRIFRSPSCREHDRVVLFHHQVYGKHWWLWSWFLADLIRRVPVAMMAAPHHYERTGKGRFPGEATINANPARLYEAIRQWCWDHQATVEALRGVADLRVVAEIGYSMGAFHLLLLAMADRIHVPMVSLSSTNDYARGVIHGVIGGGVLSVMRRAGVDEQRLREWTDSIRLERYGQRLRGKPLLYVRGLRDWVDPPPSLERLEESLQPTRSVRLSSGHLGPALRRRLVMREILSFLEELGALAGPGEIGGTSGRWPPDPERE